MIRPLDSEIRQSTEEPSVTGTDLRTLRKVMVFPEDVNMKGLKIVDIGGGVSIVTKELRTLGAKAFAVDCRYGNLDELNASLHPDSSNKLIRETFFQDYAEHKERYIPAFAGGKRLPFEDNSVDWVFSSKCLTTIVLDDFKAFLQAYEEIVRILKPYRDRSGVLVLYPWLGGISMSPVNLKNADRFMQLIKDDKRIDSGVFRVNPYLPTHLVIVKQPKDKDL